MAGSQCLSKDLMSPGKDTDFCNFSVCKREDHDRARGISVTSSEPNVDPLRTTNEQPDNCSEGSGKRKRRRNTCHGGPAMISEEEPNLEQPLRRSRRSRQPSSQTRPRKINLTVKANIPTDEKDSGLWCPDESSRPLVDDAPVFYPTEEEFNNTIEYIASIRPQAEKYGICRIVPPNSWKPSCLLKSKSFWEHAEFNTRVQQVDMLQNREPIKKRSRSQCQKKRKRRRKFRFGMARRRNASVVQESDDCAASDSEEKFGFQSGEDFTLESFKNFADEFKEKYFGIRDAEKSLPCGSGVVMERWRPSVEQIEGEYWRIVENSCEDVEVHYGADLDTGIFGSGFPKAKNLDQKGGDPYVLSGWNLNNLARLPGSILSHEKDDISGVVIPWLYVGMCFSSFCWHVEDHHLYSLNYMHFGEPKVWYGVASSNAVKLENAMRKHLPKLFEEQPSLLHELVTQLSPSVLKSEGIPVYRVVQNSGEFVITFPRAYHSGFNSGFNCAEAVNVAPIDWLPHGQCAIELYKEQRRKTSLSHDKLLMAAAGEAVQGILEMSLCQNGNAGCGKHEFLKEAIKERIELEVKAREGFDCRSQIRKMVHKDMDSSSDRECFLCYYDLYLSAASCDCSPSRFACLNHVSSLCSCEPEKKFAIYRYDLEELNTLLAALEGDLHSVRQWIRKDLVLRSPSDSDRRDMLRGEHKCSTALVVSAMANVESSPEDRNDEKTATFDLHMEHRSQDRQGPGECSKSSREDSPALDHNMKKPTVGHSSGTSSPLSSPARCSWRPEYNQKFRLKLFGIDLHQNCSTSPSDCQATHLSTDPCQEYLIKPLHSETTVSRKNSFGSKNVIFLKGSRSRVWYLDVTNPATVCSYISEVVDSGTFKVMREESPEVSFVGSSPELCWEMVRQRLNAEIINQRRMGRIDLPELQQTGSVDKMFGLPTLPNFPALEAALDPPSSDNDRSLNGEGLRSL